MKPQDSVARGMVIGAVIWAIWSILSVLNPPDLSRYMR